MKKLLSIILIAGMMITSYSFRNNDRGNNFRNDKKEKRQPMMQFSDLDTDGDGMISPKEFEDHKTKMKEKMKKMMPKVLLEKFDVDEDGELSEAERDALHKYMKDRTKQIKEKIHSMFDKNNNGRIDKDERDALKTYFQKQKKEFEAKYDTDHNGRITPDEMDDARIEDIQHIGSMLFRKSDCRNHNKRNKMKQMMMKRHNAGCDGDCDGDCKGKISEGEKASGMMQKMKKRPRHIDNPIIREYHISRFDKNKNGRIDREERDAVNDEVEKLKKRYDIDGDGRLSESESDKMYDTLLEMAREYLRIKE